MLHFPHTSFIVQSYCSMIFMKFLLLFLHFMRKLKLIKIFHSRLLLWNDFLLWSISIKNVTFLTLDLTLPKNVSCLAFLELISRELVGVKAGNEFSLKAFLMVVKLWSIISATNPLMSLKRLKQLSGSCAAKKLLSFQLFYTMQYKVNLSYCIFYDDSILYFWLWSTKIILYTTEIFHKLFHLKIWMYMFSIAFLQPASHVQTSLNKLETVSL